MSMFVTMLAFGWLMVVASACIEGGVVGETKIIEGREVTHCRYSDWLVVGVITELTGAAGGLIVLLVP